MSDIVKYKDQTFFQRFINQVIGVFDVEGKKQIDLGVLAVNIGLAIASFIIARQVMRAAGWGVA